MGDETASLETFFLIFTWYDCILEDISNFEAKNYPQINKYIYMHIRIMSYNTIDENPAPPEMFQTLQFMGKETTTNFNWLIRWIFLNHQQCESL